MNKSTKINENKQIRSGHNSNIYFTKDNTPQWGDPSEVGVATEEFAGAKASQALAEAKEHIKQTTYTKAETYSKAEADTMASEKAKTAVDKLVAGAPAALDTLKEIADISKKWFGKDIVILEDYK